MWVRMSTKAIQEVEGGSDVQGVRMWVGRRKKAINDEGGESSVQRR